jgi:hypothetical protein
MPIEVNIEVYESDGSDGYTPGTWGVSVYAGDMASGEGGFPSRRLAERAGELLARAARNWS